MYPHIDSQSAEAVALVESAWLIKTVGIPCHALLHEQQIPHRYRKNLDLDRTHGAHNLDRFRDV